MGEFDLIAKYFLPLTEGRIESDKLSNDAAILEVPNEKQLVVTSDTLVADVHFFVDQAPEMIAKKALRSNLSDLNAMGAEPYCYQLCLSLTQADEQWLAAFCQSLADDQKRYGIFLSGGDTTSTSGPLTISITAFGLVEQGRAVSRSGARDGDLIVITNTVGDAYCGLQSLRGVIPHAPESCIQAYYAPEPPMALASVLSKYANAALDISDGLLQDLEHLTKASNLSAVVQLDDIDFSDAVQSLIDAGQTSPQELLSGGDDCQLLMAVAPEKFEEFQSVAASHDISLQAIGAFKSGKAVVRLFDENGAEIPIKKSGWQHF